MFIHTSRTTNTWGWSYLLQFPESGKVVPGSGGVRKLRWAMTGTGKRGGVRVIYYFKKQDDLAIDHL
jgi:hypothetical protein